MGLRGRHILQVQSESWSEINVQADQGLDRFMFKEDFGVANIRFSVQRNGFTPRAIVTLVVRRFRAARLRLQGEV